MAPRQVPFNHGCSPHIRTEPHGIQLLRERPPWNLLRSKRPGRWRRDAKHLAEKTHGFHRWAWELLLWKHQQVEIWMVSRQVGSLGMNISREISRLNQILGGGPSQLMVISGTGLFWGDHWITDSIFCAKCPTFFYVHNQKTLSVCLEAPERFFLWFFLFG